MIAQRYVDRQVSSTEQQDRDGTRFMPPQRSQTVSSSGATYGNGTSTYGGSPIEPPDFADAAAYRIPERSPYTPDTQSTPSFSSGQQTYAAPSQSTDHLQLDRLRLTDSDAGGAPWMPAADYRTPLPGPTRTSTSSNSSADHQLAWRNSAGSVDDGFRGMADPYGGMAEHDDPATYSRTPVASSSHLRSDSMGMATGQQMGPYYAQALPSAEGGYPQDSYHRPPSFGYDQQSVYGYAPPPQQQQQQQWQQQHGQQPLPQQPYYPSYAHDAYGGGPSVPPQSHYGGGLQRTTSVSSQLTTSSAGLSRTGSTMPGGGGRGKARMNPTGRERTITKSAIDEYRNRIKADPDPESQFNFAKFLIEAARKLAQMAQQASTSSKTRDLKKYRDTLLQEAIKLMKRLATQSQGLGKPAYADAQFFLADCLSSGSLGLQVDHEKAYNLYVQASKQNHAPATYRTAVCNEGGHGTKKDPARAVLFYRKASALGNTPGMYKLGMILLNGLLNQPKNGKEAVSWLRRAAAQADDDNPHALHELGQLYERPPHPNAPSGPGPTVPEDHAQAFELYQQAARLGYGLSQYKLGMAYEYGTLCCPVDPRRSVAYYTRAAERNVADAELALSGWYLTGAEGVLQQSDQEAYLWARRAANRGLPRGEFAVGYYEEAGIGCKRDVDEAKRWYMRAAAQGNKRAMQRLTELKKQSNARVSKKPTRQDAKDECVIS